MKRLYSARALRMLFLLVSFTLIWGGNSAWAQTTATFTFTTKTDLSETKDWTSSKTLTYYNYNSTYGGVQIGASKSAAGSFSFVSAIEYTSVSLIKVTAATGGTATMNVEIGTEKLSPASSSLSTKSATYEFKPNTVASGKVVINFNASSKALYIGKIEIVYGDNGDNRDAEFSIAPAEISVKAGETATATVTTNYDGALTATSGDETIATASYTNGTLTVTGVKGGNTTITLSGAATSNYNAINKTVNVAVTAATEEPEPTPTPVTGETFYKKVTSESELLDNALYVFVCEAENIALSSIGTPEGTSTTNIKGISTEVSIENNTIQSGDLSEFVLRKSGTNYTLSTNGKFLVAKENSTNIDLDTSAESENKWVISFNNGNAKIKSTINHKSARQLLWQITDKGVKSLGDYAESNATNSGYELVQLYRKVGQFTAAEAVENHATFFAGYAYEMPAGVTGYAVTVDAETGKLTKTEAYAAGAEVPAATPLLLKATAAGTYYPAVLNKTVAAYTGANDMEGGRAADGMTLSAKGDGMNYYKLAVSPENGAGFYWGAEGGAAFKMTKPTTAYLAVPAAQTQGVRGFAFADSEVTGIENAATATPAEDAIYTLSGIRVRTAKSELPAGIYVVNGKKLMVK